MVTHLAQILRRTRKLDKYCYDEHDLTSAASFRLLILAPGKGRDTLKAQFVVTNIENPSLAYEALSYTWGSPRRSKRLLIQTDTSEELRVFQMLITSNLQLALRALRDANVPRILWVDAVCIDQEDAGEKNKQVAMMRKIYSNASRTIIYLGEDFPFCRQLRSHMPTMELFGSVHGILGKINSIDFLEHGPICGLIAVFFCLCGSVWFKPFTRRWFTSVHLAMFMIGYFL